MSKNKLIFTAIVAVLLLIVGTVVILEWFGPKRTIVLDVTGPAGSTVTGEVEVDGKLQAIDEKLPAKLTFEARHVAFALVGIKDNASQPLEVKVFVDGQNDMSVSGGGARGEISKPVLLGSLRRRMSITTASKGKIHE